MKSRLLTCGNGANGQLGGGYPVGLKKKLWLQYRAWLKDYCMSFYGELAMMAKHQVMGRRWATQDVLQGHMLQGAHDSDRSER